jgi:two-component system LytT family response regulator
MTRKLRTVLVDDEELARERLKQLLRPYDDIEIAGEAEDGEDAIDKIVELKPDLVFLDIQMPACSGIEVATSLPSPRPIIVFCTAYDQYAVEAFEVHAVDYLLKPVNRSRLAKTMDRLRQVSSEEADSKVEKATRALVSSPSRFLGKRRNRFHVIPQDDVLYFVSEGGLTKLCTASNHYWVQPTMTELEHRIDPSVFFRISRSVIVNLNAVKEVAPLVGGFGEVLLAQGTRLDVSRRRFKPLVERLEKP